MSDQLYDVAFSGQISEGATLDEVKARVGKMFKAEGAKLDALFSGQRIVIKKNADEATANKYQAALRNAGAECTLEPVASAAQPAADAPAPAAAATASAPAQPASAGDEVPPPPSTDPLGITGDQIEDLQATLAPPGAELQSEIKQVPEPQFDLSAFDLAPVGSTLSDEKKEPPPPPPDTSGLTMAD